MIFENNFYYLSKTSPGQIYFLRHAVKPLSYRLRTLLRGRCLVFLHETDFPCDRGLWIHKVYANCKYCNESEMGWELSDFD